MNNVIIVRNESWERIENENAGTLKKKEPNNEYAKFKYLNTTVST